MLNFNYTRTEAEALVGTKYETLVEWDRIAKGMRGDVIWSSGCTVWAPHGPYEKYEVVILWDRPPGNAEGREPPVRDWFSKFQMEKYMRKVKA